MDDVCMTNLTYLAITSVIITAGVGAARQRRYVQERHQLVPLHLQLIVCNPGLQQSSIDITASQRP